MTAVTERLRRLTSDAPDLEAELVRALTDGSLDDLDDLLSVRPQLSVSDLATAAEILNVPLRVLTGSVPFESDLAVSLRVGAAGNAKAPHEALETASNMLARMSVLRYWSGSGELPTHVIASHHGRYLEAGRRTALHVRDVLQLGSRPVEDLVGLVEGFGIPVAHMALPEGVHGLNVRQESEGVPERAILINCSGDHWPRQRFTLAHELCHGIYDDPGQVIVDEVDVPETLPELRAESFARHLLLPEPALRHEVQSFAGAASADLVTRVMVTYGVSRSAVLKALVDDGHFQEADVTTFRSVSVANLMSQSGLTETWSEQCSRQHEPSGSPMLVSRALEAYRLGQVGREVVAELLGGNEDEIAPMLTERGWDPPSSSGR